MNQESGDYQLSASAANGLEKAVDDLRERLLREAKRGSKGEPVGPDHIDLAWSRVGLFDREIEDAQSIITRTLRENRVVEWVAYAMAFTLFTVGIVLLCLGVFGPHDSAFRITSIISGSVLEVLLLMPVRLAINSRRHNIAIRMLGILIDRVDDPKKLAALLSEAFRVIVVGDVSAGSR